MCIITLGSDLGAAKIIREERQGVRLLVDLTKGDLASAIAAVENVLARLW
jgi:hypothetical protein